MENKNDMICFCKNISKQEIETAIENGARNLKDIQEKTNACTGNKCEELNPKGVCCSKDIKHLLPKQNNSCSCCCG